MCCYFQLHRAAFSRYSTERVERDAMKMREMLRKDKLYDNAAKKSNPKRFKLEQFLPECDAISNRQLCPERFGGLLI